MPDPKRERDRLRAREKELRRQLAILRRATGNIDVNYAEAFADMCELAYSGSTSDSEPSRVHPTSRPPKHDPRAYSVVREELHWQREQARKLRAKLNRLIEGAA
jgi:hypothetical protein